MSSKERKLHSMSQVFTKYTDTAKMQEMLDQSQALG